MSEHNFFLNNLIAFNLFINIRVYVVPYLSLSDIVVVGSQQGKQDAN